MLIAYTGDNMYEMSNLLSGKNCLLFSLLELCSGRAIMMDLLSSSVRLSMRPLTFSNNNSSEAAEPILLYFHMEPSLLGRTKDCEKSGGPLTKMAAISIYCKTFKNLLLQNKSALGLNICSDLRGQKVY